MFCPPSFTSPYKENKLRSERRIKFKATVLSCPNPHGAVAGVRKILSERRSLLFIIYIEVREHYRLQSRCSQSCFEIEPDGVAGRTPHRFAKPTWPKFSAVSLAQENNMAAECIAYRDAKGGLHASPEKATLEDLANILGRVGEEGGMTAGVAKLIFGKRLEIERVFQEHDTVVERAVNVRRPASPGASP